MGFLDNNALTDLYLSTKVLFTKAKGCSFCSPEDKERGDEEMQSETGGEKNNHEFDFSSFLPYFFAWGAMVAIMLNHLTVVVLNQRSQFSFSTLFSDVGAALCSWLYVIFCIIRNINLITWLG